MPKPRRERAKAEDRKARLLFSDFEVGLSRAVLDSNPRHPRALEMLGQALTRVGRHNEALEADLRLADLRPKDPVAFYNLACSYSNLEDLDAAFAALRRAFDLGYRDYRHLLRDPDLANVRRDRRFKSLLDKKWGKRQP
ncbi:MAG: tetratricopeptide repeat protein [Planctomycetes bacterium]|nr:tetratricopeptide repeat protein [Planctomycetota bacterium]